MLSEEPHSARRTAAVAIAGFCAFVNLYAPQPLLPVLAANFRTSAAGISLLLTASTVAVAIMAPLTGILADRVGRRRVIVPAAFLLAVPTVLSATSTGLGQLVFWRFWQGFFTPGIAVVVSAYINEEWREGIGQAMGAYVSGTVVGGFSGRLIAGLIADHWSWRLGFGALGLASTAGALLVWAWLPPDRHFRRAATPASMLPALARHMKDARLLATYAIGFCVLFSMLATFTYVNFYLAAPPFGLSPAALGMLYTVYLVGAAVTPMAGHWIDRAGHRITLMLIYSGAAAGILATLLPWLPAILLGLTLCCTAVFVAQSACYSYIGRVAHEARAAAVGLYVLFYYVGGSFGSEVPALFWSRGGWPACVALITGAQMLIILLAAIFWRPSTRRAPVLSEV
ncbi:MAG TPA: MFS transporter [Bryobacteraceae bacterium]|nr:MFS transporter [Bryobacteraceae bacterium]